MQYTKSMIDIVFQIRKVAPEELRPSIKLTNPNLMDFLAEIYGKFEEFKLKNLIKQLFSLAGPAWLSLIAESQTPPKSKSAKPAQNKHQSKHQNKQMYRGQALLSDKDSSVDNAKKGKVVMYRGQQMTVA